MLTILRVLLLNNDGCDPLQIRLLYQASHAVIQVKREEFSRQLKKNKEISTSGKIHSLSELAAEATTFENSNIATARQRISRDHNSDKTKAKEKG